MRNQKNSENRKTKANRTFLKVLKEVAITLVQTVVCRVFDETLVELVLCKVNIYLRAASLAREKRAQERFVI